MTPMKRLLRGLALVPAMGGLIGCAVLADSLPYEHHLPDRKPSVALVDILEKYPEKTYVEIARVEARATAMWVSWPALHQALREEATRIGADALVQVKPADEPDDHVVVTGLDWVDLALKPPRRVTGIAIRYLDENPS
jgi:3',5'-cyclic AMP phosphodiesterase CpdA